MDRIEEIEERLAAATPGPWEHHAIRDRWRTWMVEGPSGVLADMRHYPMAEADADLIAHAPEDMYYLLNVLGQAEAELDRCWEQTNEAIERGEGHQATDRALWCEHELETMLGVRNPAEAARVLRRLIAERDQLRAELARVRGYEQKLCREVPDRDEDTAREELMAALAQFGERYGRVALDSVFAAVDAAWESRTATPQPNHTPGV